jgi:hypothetical protein
MSEIILNPNFKAEDTQADKKPFPRPKSPDELCDYFRQKEEVDSAYEGYADSAARTVEVIDEARRYGKTDEVKQEGIEIMPGYPVIYTASQTPISQEYIELIFSIYNLEPVIDETSETNPYGRILWQSQQGKGINLIESRGKDKVGDIISLTAVSHVPEDLLFMGNFIGELRSLPTAEIDEEELVKAWIHGQAA